MKKFYILLAILIAAFAGWFYFIKEKPTAVVGEKAVDPKLVSFVADGNHLSIFGEPVYGELNNDGKQDAGVLLVYNSTGSGTFYYVAAVLSGSNNKGTNTILLGDRIAPQNIEIKDGKLIANYADRGPKDPMTVKPYIGVTKRAYIENGSLKELAVLQGRIVWGDEVRTFQPCGQDQGSIESAWIDGQSLAYKEIGDLYAKAMQGSGPYSPMYFEIIGKDVTPPQDGFGANYKKAINIDQVTASNAFGSCKQNLVVLENIKSGDYIDPRAPLHLTGRARGNWYFEASFPVQIVDRHNNVLASGFASAQGDWMTTEFVPFSSALTFTKAPEKNSTGKIILKKDNPSDMRALDDSLEVMVYFK